MKKRFKKIYCEISGVCNFSCNFCPATTKKIAREFMSQELFAKVLNEVAIYGETLFLHILGEPLLHPQFSDFLKMSKDKDVAIQLVTNGFFLLENADKICNSAIKKVAISLQSFAGNCDEEIALENVRKFIYLSQKNDPNLQIELRIWNLESYNFLEITKNPYLQWVKESFSFDILTAKIPEISEKIHSRNIRILPNLYLNISKKFDWAEFGAEKRENGFCYGLVEQIGILADGRVVPCCLDYDAKIELGNLKTEEFSAILSAPRTQNMLKNLQKRKLIEKLCQSCEFAKRF